jgi:hypothetical protein
LEVLEAAVRASGLGAEWAHLRHQQVHCEGLQAAEGGERPHHVKCVVPRTDHLWPIRKAASAPARSMGHDACEAVSAGPFQQERSISTLGLSQLLLVGALNKKSLVNRSLAKCVLTSWLAVFTGPLAAALHTACQACQADAAHLCQFGRDADGFCMHMGGILADSCQCLWA